jgi:hypothetical protein
MVMLGTPNNGCFPDEEILDYFIQYGQYLGGFLLVPTVTCKTARELIKSDAPDTSLGLVRGAIDALNDEWKDAANLPPYITISGGLNRLAFSKNPVINWVANRAIQKKMAGEANDGLVAESSVSLNSIIHPEGRLGYTHLNSYPEYPQINHSHLKDNQSIALEIISWINGIAKLG